MWPNKLIAGHGDDITMDNTDERGIEDIAVRNHWQV